MPGAPPALGAGDPKAGSRARTSHSPCRAGRHQTLRAEYAGRSNGGPCGHSRGLNGPSKEVGGAGPLLSLCRRRMEGCLQPAPSPRPAPLPDERTPAPVPGLCPQCSHAPGTQPRALAPCSSWCMNQGSLLRKPGLLVKHARCCGTREPHVSSAKEAIVLCENAERRPPEEEAWPDHGSEFSQEGERSHSSVLGNQGPEMGVAIGQRWGRQKRWPSEQIIEI